MFTWKDPCESPGRTRQEIASPGALVYVEDVASLYKNWKLNLPCRKMSEGDSLFIGKKSIIREIFLLSYALTLCMHVQEKEGLHVRG